MFSRIHPPADQSIFIKSFTKRKQEYAEDSSFDMDALQKKLADPVKEVFLRFSFLLSILFPVLSGACKNITDRFLNELQLSLSPREHSYLLNGKLII